MKQITTLPWFLTLTATTAPLVNADVFLSPASTWEYTFNDPTGDPAWKTTTGGWTSGPAPFGNVQTGAFGYEFGTFWLEDATGSLDDDLWVRTTVDLSAADLASIQYDLGIDNGFKLYANGSLVAEDNAEGYTARWEYSGGIPAADLIAGVNVIALA